MANLVCGRCGQRTAPNSTYCSHDKWVLFVDVPEGDGPAGSAISRLEVQRGMGGILARRRVEKDRSHLERAIRDQIDRRISSLEKRAEANPQDWEAQRTLGVLALLERNWERANAHLELAHRVNPNDYETTVNYAVALAQRGQLQPALELLQQARQAWPKTPILLINLAMVALEARRSALVLEIIDELDQLWSQNPAIAQDFHDEAQTLRGLALLQQNKPQEARQMLELAARHTIVSSAAVRYEIEAESAAQSLTERRQIDRRLSAPSALPPNNTERRATERRTVAASPPPGVAEARTHSPQSNNGAGAAPSPTIQPIQVEYASDQLLSDAEHEQGQDYEIALPEEDDLVLNSKTADADLLNNLGIAEATSGDFDRALTHFATAMRLEPGNARVHNNLGLLAYGQSQFQTALKHLEIAREIEDFIEQPEPSTFNHLGVVFSALGRNEESLEEFQKAGAHERAEFEVWYNLGRAYIENGKPERGVEFLRRAFQANPNNADVHTVLGAAYLLRGQMQLLPEAMKHLKRALQINGRHRSALADITMALMEMGQNEQALRVATEDVKSHPQGAEALFLLATNILRTADDAAKANARTPAEKATAQDDPSLAKAAQLFNRAFDLRPDLSVALYNMALCQYAIGFRESAAKQLEFVVQRDPSLAPAYYLIGVGYADAKKWKEALDAWTTAARYEPANPDLQANMGYVHYQRGEWTQAISHYIRAHHAAPAQADLLSSLGLCYARANQIPKAIQTFEHSLKIEPHSPITHSNLGLAFYFQTQVERALDQWRIVSQLDAAYASRREEDQYRNFDDSLVALRPLNWRARLIRMAPVLPRPHTQMVPGYNARAYRLAISDPALKEIEAQRRDFDHQSRMLGWMYAHK